MTATPPPGPPEGQPPGPPPPGAPEGQPPAGPWPSDNAPQPGPWASDNLPPHPGMPGPVADVPQPSSIATAVKLMWVGAALSIIGLLIGILTTDTTREQIEEDNPNLTADEIDTAVAVGVGFAVVISLVAVGLWIWMAWANGQGKSWARIVATVFGGLGILFGLLGLVLNPATPVSVVLTLVNLVLAIVILVLLYRPDSSRFYEARSRTW
jgi:hypothetical protein